MTRTVRMHSVTIAPSGQGEASACHRQILAAVAESGLDVRFRQHDELASRDPGTHPDNFGAGLMALPGSVQAVSGLVKLCARLSVPIVPQGGRTGLVGGTVSHPGMLVLSLERLDQIETLDPDAGIAVVQAGVTLQALQDACRPHGLEPGVDLGARGSATLGGMAATNAGGMQAFRNGVMRHRVLGLEAVMADGQLLSDMTQVIKSTSGYDVKQLLIGSEGTLGIITRIVVSLVPLPQGSATALLALPDAANALRLTGHLRKTPGITLLTSELMTRDFLQMNAEAHGLSLPQGVKESPVTLLVEIEGPSDEAAVEQLETVLNALPEECIVTDGTIAQTLKQRDELWHLREDMSVYARQYPGYLSCDISVPGYQIDQYLELMKQRMAALSPPLEALIFAHIADGNLHVITKRAHLTGSERSAAEDAIYAPLPALGGSISAEHGIGIKKSRAYNVHVSVQKKWMIAQIKAALDPLNIFNPDLFPGYDHSREELDL